MIGILAYSENGRIIAENLEKKIKSDGISSDVQFFSDVDSKEQEKFIENQFLHRYPIIFIGATGIAVRKIAPFIDNKLVDSPVIVIDDQANFVIPILSGHVGGANILSEKIAALIDATPVITTATDNAGIVAIDNLAVKNNLAIHNKEGIKKISSRSLKGEEINILIDIEGRYGDYLYNIFTKEFIHGNTYRKKEEISYNVIITDDKEKLSMSSTEILYLAPKKYVVGIGCKKLTPKEKLMELINETFEKNKISVSQIIAICSIDVKAKETGIVELAHDLGVDFITYSANELSSVIGDFDESSFVRETVGVGNVCERAVVRYLSNHLQSKMNNYYDDKDELFDVVQKKIGKDGMAIAIGRI